MLKAFSYISVIAVLLFASEAQAKGGKDKGDPKLGFVIEGQIEGLSKEYIYFDHFDGTGPVKSDSALCNKKGKFKMQVADTTTNFYRLSLSDKNFVLLFLTPGETVKITAKKDTLNANYAVTGSEHSAILCDFYNKERVFINKSESLRKAFEVASKANDPQAIDEYKAKSMTLSGEYRTFVLAFIDSNAASPASLIPLGKLKVDQDFDSFRKVRDGLIKTFPQSEYTKQVATVVGQREAQLEREKVTSVGGEAREIALNDTAGNPVSLSSFRGKYVLVDFWASWCRPCRAENPNVVRMYNKYKDKGFEVFSVSLDNKKSRWVSAIAKDQLTWTHVSDLKGWKSAAAQLYGVQSIPYTVLVDPEGNIIAKQLRGAALESKLQEIFGF